MAIVINSLTPVNPTTVVGGFITFVVDAQDTTVGTQLEYEWQFSSNLGTSYTPVGLFNNTASTFTTSALSQNQSGLYFRVKITSKTGSTINEVVYSNDVPAIGDRIIVVQSAPVITVFNEYNPSYTVAVNDDVTLIVSASVFNVDVSTLTAANTNLANLTIQWQESTDNGVNWVNVVDNMPGATGNFKYDITQQIVQISTTPSVYAKQFTLVLQDLTFNSNLRQYRAVLSYSTATNTPATVNPTTILINPVISIYQHPGDNLNDTRLPVQCYKTGISNSGSLRVSVGALTTSGQSLAYTWQFATVDYNNNLSNWLGIQIGIDNNWFRYKTGTNGSSDVLELDRVIYFEKIAFRVIISGTAGETTLTSNSYYILMKDVQVLPGAMGDKQSLEDFYDPAVVPNSQRSFYTDYPIQTVEFLSYINVARNTGINGKVILQFQRQAPGSSTWSDIGTPINYVPSYTPYTATPTNNIESIDISYTTLPVRVNLDNNSKYRIKVTSTALYTLNNGVKTLTEYYSAVSTLSVYRVVYITTQPADVYTFVNLSAAFSVVATTTSPATITYQWQSATSLTSTWQDINGQTSSIYSINPVPSTITRPVFRCVVNATGTLPGSSVNSNDARIIIRRDLFSSFTSLNDYSVDEFQSVSWTVNAESLSLGTLSYQWQKSTNYNPASPESATWTPISGQTTNTFTIASVLNTDQGYYRCRITSLGGEIAYTNAAFLSISLVRIVITKNIATSLTFLEGLENERTFSVEANASKGPQPTYQWQIKRVGESQYSNIGLGYQNQADTSNNYTPKPFNTVTDNGAKIRCEIRATEIPNPVYSNECTITVNRRFYYFADSAIKTISSGDVFSLDLNPVVTGGTPSYQWQRSTNNGSTWSAITGETSSILFIPNVSSSINNYLYRCQVTLANCTQYQYSRNGVVYVDAASTVGYTQSVKLNVSTIPVKPRYYSKQTEKTGAAIGTVICIPKPANYVNDPSDTTDDITKWGCSISGHSPAEKALGGSSLASSSSSIYATNKPSWVTDTAWKSPKWLVSQDRFPGFIELRGQWLRVVDFPLLYQVIGNTYGTATNSSGQAMFKLPNPYGKKIMGTGNVNNTGGSVSIVPEYEPNGISGGDKNVAGSIGGVWNYSKSAQLPPGSPGSSNEPDGTAGTTNEPTFSLGNYSTTGFTECEGVAETVFTGQFSFRVGPLLNTPVPGVPPHVHRGISAGAVEGFRAHSGSCRDQGTVDPSFYGVTEEGGRIDNGPEGVPAGERGLGHSHGLAETYIEAGNGSSNHELGIGSTNANASVTLSANIHSSSSSVPSANVYLEPAPIRLTNSTRPIFNSSLSFYLRNNELLPVNSDYFRLKYLIKAY